MNFPHEPLPSGPPAREEPGPGPLQPGVARRHTQEPQGHVVQDAGEDVAVRLDVEAPASVGVLVVAEVGDEPFAHLRLRLAPQDLQSGDVDRDQEERPAVVPLPRTVGVLRRSENLQAPLDGPGSSHRLLRPHGRRPGGNPRAHSSKRFRSAASSVTLSRVTTMIRITVSRSIFTGAGSKTAGL